MSAPVTKDQYEFFRSLYEEEERTSLQLEGRAKVYLGIISAFLTALVVRASDTKGIAEALHLRWGLLLLEALPMISGLLIVLWALRIRSFEAVNDGPDVIVGYGSDWPTEEQFFEDRIADYAFASSVNRKLNNDTATLLFWAGLSIGVGILYVLAMILFAIRR